MRHYFWEYPRVEMRFWSRIRFEVIRHRFSFTLALLHSPWHTSFCASIWSSWQYICSLTKLLPLNVWLQFSQADSHISTKKHGFCRYTCSWYVCTFTLINDWYRYYKILILLHLMSNLQAYASIAVFFSYLHYLTTSFTSLCFVYQFFYRSTTIIIGDKTFKPIKRKNW